MRRIFLKVAYDGTNYNGWQEVSTGKGIETEINKALAALLPNEKPKVIGASRTDAGVHALSNVCVFDTNSTIEAEKFAFAINDRLPADIRIRQSKEVDASFHPRKANSIKTYEYKIYSNKTLDPTKRLYFDFVYYAIDISKMQEACKYLIGTHDFKAFANPEADIIKQGRSSERTIYSIEISRNEDDIIITYTGDGFLYHMVRIISACLIRVGTGMWECEKIKEILDSKDRKNAAGTAPACGLTLKSIDYI